MDTFTHALFPFLSGKVAKKDAETCMALLIGGLAPDFDLIFLFINAFFGSALGSIPSTLLLYHRGITHSIIFGILFSWLALYVASRKPVLSVLNYFFKSKISLAITPKLLFFTAIGTLSHLFLDFTTTYGIPLFYPFSLQRYSMELFFYIDIYLTAASLALTAYMFYKRGWLRTPFGASTGKIEVPYNKIFVAFIGVLLLFGGLRYAEKTASAENFGTGIDSVYPSFNPYVWYVVEQAPNGTEVTVFTFDSSNKKVLSQYELNNTEFADIFPRHSFLVGRSIRN
ncbi:LexA-binding, inner membrane-associated putative hydrolase [uncultured archaeon]|nr:LexA-binding, inner membrane-associated putative hydrolase [uncultured archaeon]